MALYALPDYYRILGVSRTASPHEIKAAYRRLALRYHPDLHPNNPHAEDILKTINQAYAVLGNAQQRQQYDRQIAPALTTTQASPARPAATTPHYTAPRYYTSRSRARPKTIYRKMAILMWVLGLLAAMTLNLLTQPSAELRARSELPAQIELVLRTPQQAVFFADRNGVLHSQETGIRRMFLGLGDKLVMDYDVEAKQGRVFIGIKGQAVGLNAAAPFTQGEWIERPQSGTIELLISQAGEYVIFLHADNFAGTVLVQPRME